ncbi:phage tail assembly chaperone [Pseudoalteromonas luteoviolacea]|uniref:Phage tail assembly chaperone-like domain-containing protein n=1 Tax=Pseudoalteromonas luteoviolacea NCIMB 1942 TaxID=1365253 RepID=A0A167FZZ3_9GAMM|nr:phage tail assembly chaperone [Pseudoalteromonas luteoviolacea]KZN53432.1 hypothetical protein N482_24930 [Pseudoalteromonas luteoviolacea NCIMB 1942]
MSSVNWNDVSWVTVRSRRNNLLIESDVWVLRTLEKSNPIPVELSDYRQALRKLPETATNPTEVVWPKYEFTE